MSSSDRRGWRPVALSLLAPAAIACAGAQFSPPPGGTGPVPDCRTFASRGLVVLADSRSALRSELGEPAAVEREPVENRHVAGQVDTLVTWAYEGLDATFYVLPNRDLRSSITVTADRWLRYSSPGIGDSPDRVAALLGVPDAVDETELGATSWRYSCSIREEAEEPFFVELREGAVAAFRFTYYVD